MCNAAAKINTNFSVLWQGTYNSKKEQPTKAFVVGLVNDGYSKPSAGQMNAYNNGTPSNMKYFVNFCISQSDESGAVRTIPIQRNYASAIGLYDSVTTTSALTIY